MWTEKEIITILYENMDDAHVIDVPEVAKIIVARFAHQTRIQAMATLTRYHYQGLYYVPTGGARFYSVQQVAGKFECDCPRSYDCEHIQALKLKIEQERIC